MVWHMDVLLAQVIHGIMLLGLKMQATSTVHGNLWRGSGGVWVARENISICGRVFVADSGHHSSGRPILSAGSLVLSLR